MSRRVWLLWHLALWTSFAWLEYRAIKKRRWPTQSDWLRLTLGVGVATRRDRHFLAVAFTGLLLWFFGHILLGWGPYVGEDQKITFRRSRNGADSGFGD
jgi:hypothetical protein